MLVSLSGVGESGWVDESGWVMSLSGVGEYLLLVSLAYVGESSWCEESGVGECLVLVSVWC